MSVVSFNPQHNHLGLLLHLKILKNKKYITNLFKAPQLPVCGKARNRIPIIKSGFVKDEKWLDYLTLDWVFVEMQSAGSTPDVLIQYLCI